MQYDFSLSANGSQTMDVVGYYIKYKSGIGSIRVRTSAGGYVDMTPGQGIKMASKFNKLTIEERTGQGNIGVLMVGELEFQDDSIVGTVNVVDGGKNSTLAASCFMGTANSGTSAGYYNAAGLVNPAGNPKIMVIEGILISSAVDQAVSISHSTFLGGVVGSGYNKLMFSGAQSSAKLAANPSVAVANFGSEANRLYVKAYQSQVIKFAEPLILPPSRSLQVVSNIVAAEVIANFEWREDPI